MKLDDYENDYKKHIAIAKMKFEKGFTNKSQQKDCLSYISSAFYDKSKILQQKLLDKLWAYRKEHNGEDDKQLNDLYFDVPTYPHELKEKTIKKYQSYPEINDLIEIKNFYDKVKGIEIIKKIETPIEKKQKIYTSKIKMMDRSNITDEKAYMNAINKIVQSADKILTPIYEEEANRLVSILNMPQEELQEKLKNKSFNNFYTIMIEGKNEKQIRKSIEEEKELELLDIQFKAMEKLNFDIKTIKLKSFSNNYKSWIINSNRLFEIEVIVAGGYNIQRLHTRCLVKLKNI